MKNKKKVKTLFFEKGVSAINLLTGKDEEFYHCPICRNPFPQMALDNKDLTLEHIPPKAQGGKGIALTCSRCNKTAGHSIDSAVFSRNELKKGIESLLTRNQEYKGRVQLNFGEENLKTVNANLSVKDSEVKFFVIGESNHPQTSERIKKFITKVNQGDHLHLPTIKVTHKQKYNLWLSKVGDLRTAFLICFAFFGYRYVFDKRLEPVRNQIINYKEELIEGFWSQSDGNSVSNTNLYIIDKPFPALLVQLGKISILLPWLESFENFYEFVIQEKYLTDGQILFTGVRLPWPQTLELNLDFYKRGNHIVSDD
jgi:hypothetical protein